MGTLVASNGSGLEVLFWIVVAVIWVVAQIARAARRQGKGTTRPGKSVPVETLPTPQAEGQEWEQQLTDFLESLGGDEPPRSVPPPPPPQVAGDLKKETPVMPVEPVTAPAAARAAPKRSQPAGRRFSRPPPAPTAPIAPGDATLPSFVFPAAREMDAATSARRPIGRVGTQEVLLPTDGLLGMKSFSLATPRMDDRPSTLALIGWSQDRTAFRQAMISHIVLGTPRGLDPQAGMSV